MYKSTSLLRRAKAILTDLWIENSISEKRKTDASYLGNAAYDRLQINFMQRLQKIVSFQKAKPAFRLISADGWAA